MKIIERTFDATTGETTDIERDETAQETAGRLQREAEIAEALNQAQAEATAKAALLAKLGITADEAKLLLS
jgi:hypothetical protein